jgi:hypothetical protein
MPTFLKKIPVVLVDEEEIVRAETKFGAEVRVYQEIFFIFFRQSTRNVGLW